MTPLCTGASACATINIKYPRQENTIKSQVLQQWIALGFLRYSIHCKHSIMLDGWPTGGGGARTRCYCWLIAWLLAWHSDGQTDIQTNGSTCSHGIFQKPRRRLSDFLSVRPVSLSDSLWRGADTRLFIFSPLVVHIFSRNITGTSGRYLLGDLVVVVAVEGLDGRSVGRWWFGAVIVDGFSVGGFSWIYN